MPVGLASSSMTTSKIFDGGAQPTVVTVKLALRSMTTSKNFEGGGQLTDKQPLSSTETSSRRKQPFSSTKTGSSKESAVQVPVLDA